MYAFNLGVEYVGIDNKRTYYVLPTRKIIGHNYKSYKMLAHINIKRTTRL